MNKWIELLIGLLLLVGAILLWALTINSGFWDFGTAAWEFLKGGIVWGIVFLGLLFVLLGISDIRRR